MASRFRDEIFEQPEALRRCVECYPGEHATLAELPHLLTTGAFRQIILTGMGSSLHACYPLWLVLNAQCAVPAVQWDTSELVHHASTALDDRTLLIAVSQSGETVEIQRLAQLDRRPGLVVAVSNGVDNTLAKWSDIVIDTGAGEEAAVSTKTYVTTLAALYLLGTGMSGWDLNAAGERVLQVAAEVDHWLDDWQLRMQEAVDFLGECDNLAFMGRGVSMASVRTGSLITMESSKLFCLGLSSGQFRHGPLELAGAGFKSVVFAGHPPTRALNEKLALEIAGYGGKVLLITSASLAEPTANILQVRIPRSEAGLSPIFEIVPIQFLATVLATARGVEPATFRHAGKVTRVE